MDDKQESVTRGNGGLVGERRVITALFCDVVNSTALAERLDPEDWSELINGALQVLTGPVLRYGGSVNKLLGDGLLAFFGAPIAHEDDPQRAVLAGLAMLDAIGVYRAQVRQAHGIDFAVRIGVNTGSVVVGGVGNPGAAEYTALGDAVNVAARMEQTAAPGTVQISADTYRFVAPLFDVEPLGEIELKGKSERVAAYRVTGPKAEPGRLRGIEGVSAPLVGRDRELGLLLDAMHRLADGRGQIVCLMGEAGLGKSRLLSEMSMEWKNIGPATRWEVMTGVPYDSARPFGLFQNFARQMFGVDLEDSPEEVHRKIEAALSAGGESEEVVALCSVAFQRVIAAKILQDKPNYPSEMIRKDIFDNMLPGLRQQAETGPVVVVADDLQWADHASVDLMLHFLSIVEDRPVLFVCAFRPDRDAPAWQIKLRAETDYPHRYTEIQLRPLSSEDTDRLVSELLVIADLPPELRELILRKADGNPYFVEEIVRTLIDDGVVYRTEDGLHWRSTAKLEDISIPDSLLALLMARIDRLDQETRTTLQLASVIGRSFYYRLLKAISDSAMSLDRQLGSLERVELLREASRRPELEYMFRHELARDAAYSSILNRRRRDFHQRVAEAMEIVFADHLEEHAHRLAQHFMLGGDYVRAAKYYELAADNAAGVHAGPEGLAHLDQALVAAKKAELDAGLIDRLSAKRARLAATADA